MTLFKHITNLVTSIPILENTFGYHKTNGPAETLLVRKKITIKKNRILYSKHPLQLFKSDTKFPCQYKQKSYLTFLLILSVCEHQTFARPKKFYWTLVQYQFVFWKNHQDKNVKPAKPPHPSDDPLLVREIISSLLNICCYRVIDILIPAPYVIIRVVTFRNLWWNSHNIQFPRYTSLPDYSISYPLLQSVHKWVNMSLTWLLDGL